MYTESLKFTKECESQPTDAFLNGSYSSTCINELMFLKYCNMERNESHREPLYLSSIWDLIIIISTSIASIFVNWKYLKALNNDGKARESNSNENAIKHVVSTQSKIQIVFLPVFQFWAWIGHQDFELPTWFRYSLCYKNYFASTFRIYVGFTSLVIAAMRYTFIVHHNSVLGYGVEKLKTLFYRASILIPVVLGILRACTFPSNYIPFLGGIPNSICFDSNGMSNYSKDFKLNLGKGVFDSPIYLFVHQYVSTEITYYVSKCVLILGVVIMTNVVDGILYWKTFTYNKRYHKHSLFDHNLIFILINKYNEKQYLYYYFQNARKDLPEPGIKQ